MTCAIYARCSSDKQSTDHQLRALRDYCAAKGWAAAEYVDEAVSSRKMVRPALDAMLADARAGKLSVIVFWAFDRLARSVRELVTIFDECKRNHVQLISISQQIDTSNIYGEMVFHVLAAVAQLERGIFAERVKSGLKAAKARGVRLGAKQVHDRTKIVTLRLSGESVRSIARILNVPRSSVGRIVEKSGATVRSD